MLRGLCVAVAMLMAGSAGAATIILGFEDAPADTPGFQSYDSGDFHITGAFIHSPAPAFAGKGDVSVQNADVSIEHPIAFTFDRFIYTRFANHGDDKPITLVLFGDNDSEFGYFEILTLPAGERSKVFTPSVPGKGWLRSFHIEGQGPQIGQFDDLVLTTLTVPEPSTWATMLLGFGGIGASLRRNRLAHKAA